MLTDYVLKYAVQGACTCGKCIPTNPEDIQLKGHTVNLTLFSVAKSGGDKEEFLSLVKEEYPEWLNGKEHNYITIGADIGDQGIALMIIGLGHLLGAWKALSPDTMMPFLEESLKQQMAGKGMVSLKRGGKDD